MILEHLDKNNLHHAYLIEGERDEVVPEILEFIKSLGIETTRNADVSRISLDSFKIEDAYNLKSYAVEKGFSLGHSQTGEASTRKIFIISANNFLLEAQNSLLKLFEEPIENTHFFIVTPDASALLKTLVSRFYFISAKSNLREELEDAEKFITMPLKNRIDFIKELLSGDDNGEENETITLDSNRSKALKFLNALEVSLHSKLLKNPSDVDHFNHFFKIREFLRVPGSSAKTLMESVALTIPNF